MGHGQRGWQRGRCSQRLFHLEREPPHLGRWRGRLLLFFHLLFLGGTGSLQSPGVLLLLVLLELDLHRARDLQRPRPAEARAHDRVTVRADDLQHWDIGFRVLLVSQLVIRVQFAEKAGYAGFDVESAGRRPRCAGKRFLDFFPGHHGPAILRGFGLVAQNCGIGREQSKKGTSHS